MGQRIAIRSLTERKPQRAETARQASLPERVLATKPRWDNLALASAEDISSLIGREVEVVAKLALATEESWRQTSRWPGLLQPLARGHALRIPGGGARQLSDAMLGSASAEIIEPGLLDRLVLTPLIEQIFGVIEKAFAYRLECAGPPQFRWPIDTPSQDAALLVTLELVSEETELAVIELFLRDGGTAFAGMEQEARTAQPAESIPLPLTGILSRWKVELEEVSGLKAGQRLVIPGGDLGRIRLETEDASGSILLSHAELGTIRGRHGLRLIIDG
jgi:hypothetical protein